MILFGYLWHWWFSQMNIVITQYLSNLEQRQLKEDVTKVLQGVIADLEYDVKQCMTIEMGNDGYISSITYDSLYLQQVLTQIIKQGEKQLLEISEFSYEMKLGMFTRNIYLADSGPVIHLKLKTQPYLQAKLDIAMEPYGVNNTLVTIAVIVYVNMYTISPMIHETMTIDCYLPIVIQLVAGKTLVGYPVTLP